MRKISKINFRDIQAFNGLRLCGYALRIDMESIVSRNRVDTMIRQGYIESKTDIKGREVLTYTDKGKSFMKQLDSLQGRAFYSKQNATHDTALFQKYVALSPSERMSCLSEGETRDRYQEALDSMRSQGEQAWEHARTSVPDLSYTRDTGEVACIEIATSNYTQDKIEAKFAFSQAIGAELELTKI